MVLGGGLYLDDFSVGCVHNVRHQNSSKEQHIWLCHCRLRHPSFGYMRHMFPDLFTNMQSFDFKCNTCILAKSHRTSYPLSVNKSSIPFALIHSDVWGPSPITTVSGVRWFCYFFMIALA